MQRKPIACCGAGPEQVVFPAELAQQAEQFRALGDEIRLKALYLVRDQAVCVCDLVPLLGVVQSTLSHHLKVLQGAGLVSARREGRWNYYQATGLAKALMVAPEGKPHG